MKRSINSRTTNELFDKLYMSLNKHQKNAVDSIEGPVMVIAGPGTGKTTILTLRIANILSKTDTSPENILALTFTESATSAMRKKLVDIIGSPAYKVNIHTFHGFAERIIGEHPDYFARIIGSSIIKDIDQIKIIKEIVESRNIELLRPYGDPTYYVRPIIREIHLLKRENIDPDTFLASVKDNIKNIDPELSPGEKAKTEKQNEKNLELAFVYKEYEKKLAKDKYYDFDDMLLELIRAMEHNTELKLILQETFQYILADEHQDANASQNKILELLSDFHDSPNLFIVGDEKQAIYRFQGASLENFLYFTEKYKDAKVIDLVNNYRSHQVILDASHSLIEKNPSIPGRKRISLLSPKEKGELVDVVELDTIADEYEYIADTIESLASKDPASIDEIAILYRDNSHSRDISKILKKHGIKHRVESDVDILSNDLVLKIDTMLRTINDPSLNEYLAKTLLFSEMKCDPGEVRQAFNDAYKSKRLLCEDLKKKDNTCGEAYKQISKWSKLASEKQLLDFLDIFLKESGIHNEILKSKDAVEKLSVLESFYKSIEDMTGSKKNFFLADYVSYMDIIKDYGIMAKKKYTDHTGGVRLMTAHRSKGLEFNTVFIVHANDGIWGNRTSRKYFNVPVTEHVRDSGRIDDERRLFYVAMTRARNKVIVTYSNNDGEKDMTPSQFVLEIDGTLVSKNKANIAKKVRDTRDKAQKEYEETSILNKDFVASVFKGQALSVTHINNFLDCPWKYFFVNLIRIPKSEEKHQMYGTAVHETLKVYFDNYKEENDLKIDNVIDIFKHELDSLPLSVDDKEDSYKKGKKAMEGYVKEYYPSWHRNLVTEYAVSALFDVNSKDSIKLTGKLDKVEIVGDGVVNVVDYKTGKPKSRNDIEGKTKSADGNYMRQLIFYKLLLDLDGKFSMRSGELDFIEPNERGKYKKESFEISKEQVSDMENVIKDMYKNVTGLSFKDEKCEDDQCEFCKLADIIKASI